METWRCLLESDKLESIMIFSLKHARATEMSWNKIKYILTVHVETNINNIIQ